MHLNLNRVPVLARSHLHLLNTLLNMLRKGVRRFKRYSTISIPLQHVGDVRRPNSLQLLFNRFLLIASANG